MTSEATNQIRDRQPERPDRPRERAADEQRPGDPRHDRQHVEGEELGVLVGEADARRDAAGAVDELELVELVAERDRQQEQPAEDGQVDADRRREDQPAARRTDDVAREGQDQGDEDDAVEQPLDEPQERQLEQEEADVAPEDRIGDARGRRERDAVEVEQDRLPRPRQRPADEERDEQGDPAEDPARERREIGHVPDFEGDGLACCRTGRGRHRTPDRATAASVVGRLGGLVDAADQRSQRARAIG